MKTITEFTTAALKNAKKSLDELKAAGKAAEEINQALKDSLKLEDPRLNQLLGAVEAVGEKLDDLKRVIVYQLAEGEKAINKAVQKGDFWFLSEYFPPLHRKQHPAHPSKEDRHGKGRGDKKRGRGGRGKPGDNRGEKRTEKRDGAGERGERGAPRERKPRPPMPPKADGGPAPRITPVKKD